MIAHLLQVAGALAFFIYGMKVMSEGIQKAGGAQMRKVLEMMTRNKYLGVLTGFLITGLVQSSSATTVMTVSFVNAGLLSLVESAGIIMGANIGTTITAWLITILGFQVKLHTLSVPLFAIAVPLLFIRRGKARFWGEFLIGFALLFLGLNFLKESIPNLQEYSGLLSFLSKYSNWGFVSGLLFILIGAVLTAIVQSSSAAMALILVISANGWISLEVAATMVLGMNIGTTITAEVASLVGNVFAKRSARIHTLFNVFGVCWMFILTPIFLRFLDHILQTTVYTNSAFTDKGNVPIALSAFHTAFNILNTVLFIFLIPWLVNLASRTVRSKGEEDEIQRLDFSINPNEPEEMFNRINKYEEITNRIEKELTEYLINISKEKVSTKTAAKIRGLIDSCNELERIADIFYQMSITIDRKRKEKIWFNQNQRVELEKLFDLIDKAFSVMSKNLAMPFTTTITFEEALSIENQINQQRDTMRRVSNESVNKEEYNVYSALIYNNLFSALERIGDHIKHVTQAILEDA